MAALLLAAGCRGSGADVHLIERELRCQEDQIYALEDYLAECHERIRHYQQENSRLRHQLATRDAPRSTNARKAASQVEEASPAAAPPQREPRAVPEAPPPSDPPSSELPGRDSQPSRPVLPPDLPDVPPLDIPVDPPDVPELETQRRPIPDPEVPRPEIPPLDEELLPPPPDSTSDVRSLEDGVASASPHPQVPWIAAVPGGASPDRGPAPRGEGSSRVVSWLAPHRPARARRVMLQVSHIAGTGNRRLLHVTVSPQTADLEAADFEGTASLMLRRVASGSGPRQLARWDFSAAEVAAAWTATAHGRALQFDLPLPEDVSAEVQVQLWVRLVGSDGEKLLDHLRVTPPEVAGRGSARLGDDWSVAAPGRPSLVEQPQASQPDWRAAPR